MSQPIQKMLLSGGTGFLGSHLARHLLKQGMKVAILKRPQSSLWRLKDIEDKLTLIDCDYQNPDKSRSEIEKFGAQAFCHLGWFGVSDRAYDDPRQITHALRFTRKIFYIAKDSGCRLWIGLGSQAEYGLSQEKLTESSPLNPVTLYGKAKAEACAVTEKLCREHKMDFLWLRLFSCYGPADNPQWLIPYIILNLLEGKRPALTQGIQLWDYLYVEDAAEAIARASLEPKARGIFNLASGESRPIKEIAETIRDLINPKACLGLGEVPYGPNGPQNLIADVSKLQAVIRWKPRHNLQEGLKQTVDWFSKNRRQYAATEG